MLKQDPSERPLNFLPRQYEALRKVPLYDRLIQVLKALSALPSPMPLILPYYCLTTALRGSARAAALCPPHSGTNSGASGALGARLDVEKFLY